MTSVLTRGGKAAELPGLDLSDLVCNTLIIPEFRTFTVFEHIHRRNWQMA